jgi:hypothetical protein
MRRRRTLLAASDDKGQAVATQGSSSNSRLIAVGAVVLLFGVILVLLILRGTVGGDDPAPPEAAQDEETDAEGQPTPDTERPDLVAEGEGSTARIPLPLELEDGMEAVSVRASFARGVAALPAAGDRVVVYQLGEAEDDDEDEPGQPAPDGDADRVLDDVEVLGVIGPRPAANDGTLTFVLAVEEAEVPGLLPIARDGHLWLTLLPGDEADADADGPDDGEDEA